MEQKSFVACFRVYEEKLRALIAFTDPAYAEKTLVLQGALGKIVRAQDLYATGKGDAPVQRVIQLKTQIADLAWEAERDVCATLYGLKCCDPRNAKAYNAFDSFFRKVNVGAYFEAAVDRECARIRAAAYPMNDLPAMLHAVDTQQRMLAQMSLSLREKETPARLALAATLKDMQNDLVGMRFGLEEHRTGAPARSCLGEARVSLAGACAKLQDFTTNHGADAQRDATIDQTCARATRALEVLSVQINKLAQKTLRPTRRPATFLRAECK